MTHFDESCDPVKLMERNVSCLLYADDLVLISESAIGFQNSLNILSCYCDKWNLTVNLDKTKSMIFNKAGRKLTRESFFYKNNRIDLGMEYKTLLNFYKRCGIIM